MATEVLELRNILSKQLKYSVPRADCLAQLILSMLRVKNVNLVELATGFNSSAKPESNYKRIQRFLRDFEMNSEDIGKYIFGLFPFGATLYVAIDRTNWMFGTKNINILMASICYNGISIPIAWKLLNKRGNSNFEERKKVLDKVLKITENKYSIHVLGDREFKGVLFLNYLQTHNMGYTIRLTKDITGSNAFCGLFDLSRKSTIFEF